MDCCAGRQTASEPLLEVWGLVKCFGAMMVTAQVDLHLLAGEIHAIIGPNGAGKTTLIAQLAGELPPDEGRIQFAGKDITALPAYTRSALGIGRSFQITSVLKGFSALDNVALAVQSRTGHSFRFWQRAREVRSLQDAAMNILHQVGLAKRAQVTAGRLSYGEQRQLEIAMVLGTRPRLLLLDEPLAGMGAEESERMISLLRSLRGKHTLLLVEHDMDAVFALADRITVLVYGRVLAAGTVDEIRSRKEVCQAYLGHDAEGSYA